MIKRARAAMGIIASIFLAVPAWSAPADCPQGVSQDYCEIAKATGGIVIACDAKVEGQKACMEKFNEAMAQSAARDKAKAERERAINAEATKKSRENMLKSMPESEREAYMEYERKEQSRRAMRQMGLGLFAVSALGFLATFAAWLVLLGKSGARPAGAVVGVWLLAAGVGAMMEVGLAGSRGGMGFGLVAVLIPSLACSLACMALAKGEIGKFVSWGRRCVLAFGALVALAAGLLPGLLGVMGMMH